MNRGKYPALSQETIAILQSDLYSLLDRFGPCTKTEIKRQLRWFDTRLSIILASQPDWLVVVGLTRSESKFGRNVLYHCRGEHVMGVCGECNRRNFHPALKDKGICHRCLHVKAIEKPKRKRTVPGVDIEQPTNAAPGSEIKKQILGARLDSGLPLHVDGDEYLANPDWEITEELDEED